MFGEVILNIYEYDLLAFVLFLLGLHVLKTGRLSFQLQAGSSGVNTFVNNSPKVSKNIKLNTFQARGFGVALMLIGILIYFTMDGRLLFVL